MTSEASRRSAEKDSSDPFAAARAITHDPYAAARAWKADGGRVVAYLCDNVPVEMISAAQFLPCRIAGARGPGRDAFKRLIGTQYRASRFGLTAAILESLAGGECDFADHLVVPHNRKAIEAIHGQLTRARLQDPGVTIPESWILDRSWLHGDSSRRFNDARIEEFRAQLDEWRGSTTTDAELREACDAHAENRRLLGTIMALRFASPPRLSGSDALNVIRAGQLLPVEQYNALLHDIVKAADDSAALSGPRVFLAGSPYDHDQLYRVVEEAGGVVVGEDHCWGMRWTEHELQDHDDPMQAIAARYHRTAGCSIACPLQLNVDACLRRARSCGAEAVIFAVMAGDDTHNWTTPDELAAVRDAGLHTLHLGKLRYDIDDEAAAKVREFVGSLS